MSTISAPQSFAYSIPLVQRSSISLGIPSTVYSFGIPIFLPLILFVNSLLYAFLLKSIDVESFSSYVLIISWSRAQSFTFLDMGPAWSRDDAKATIPYLEQLP